MRDAEHRILFQFWRSRFGIPCILAHNSCALIYMVHALSGHNWKKTGSIFISMLVLVLLGTASVGTWLLASAGKLQLIFE